MHQGFQMFFKSVGYLLLYLIFFEFSRLCFVLYNCGSGSAVSLWLESARHGLRLDLSASAYCITIPLLIHFFEIAFNKNLQILHKIYIIISSICIVIITLTDCELFAKWGHKFSSQVLVYISHPKEMALSAGDTNWLKVTTYALFLSAVAWLLYRTMKKLTDLQPVPKRLHLLTLALYMGLTFLLIRGGTGVTTISQSSAIYSNKPLNNAAAVNSFWNAFYFIFSNTNDIYGNSLYYLDENTQTALFKEQLPGAEDSVKVLNAQRPNIIVIMLESFTANASNYFSGRNNCTPYLDSIAKQSLSFTQCYASGDRTEKGLVNVISGYPAQPLSSIIVFPDKMAKLPGISKTLKKEGYRNLYFYGGDAEFAAMKSYLIVQQFDDIVDRSQFAPATLTSKWGAHDEHLYKKAEETLSKINQPFFATIMTLSSHEPFDVPYQGKQAPGEWYGFKNSIEYADRQLFLFLESLKKQTWYNNTLVILVADHGHDIGLKDVHYFGPEKYHIPLIITGGALKTEFRGKAVNHVISQTGIPQFICHQLHLSAADFQWQTGWFDSNGFAQYAFNNGFGRVDNHLKCLFDNPSGACYFLNGTGDSSRLVNRGKAFQQQLVKDFLSK